MIGLRSRKEQVKYRKYLKTHDASVCPFCSADEHSPSLIEETDHFKVITNQFPYSLWDSQPVTSHYMITPKTHTDSIAKFTSDQKGEYVTLLEKYHKKGYNSYTRAGTSPIRSIAHFHTHLIQPGDLIHRFALAIRKPYIRIIK